MLSISMRDKILRLYISSRDRISGTDDNFLYQINTLGSLIQDVSYYQIESVTLPKTYFLINSQTNQLIIRESVNPPVTITVNNGNYSTMAALLTQIQTNINTSGLVNTYSVTINPNTGFVTIARTAGALLFNITYPTTSALSSILGIPAFTIQVTTVTGTKNVQNANNQGPDSLFIRSYTLSNRTIEGMTAIEASQFSNIITQVVMSDINFGEIKHYEPVLSNKIPISFAGGLSSFDFQLNYSSSFINSTVDLNNNSWEIVILLYI